MFGTQQSIPDLVREQWLKWLGHVGRMEQDRLPKQLLVGDHAVESKEDGEM